MMTGAASATPRWSAVIARCCRRPGHGVIDGSGPARRPRRAPSPMSLWRLLWLELQPQRDAPRCSPCSTALFVLDPFRTAMDYPPLWDLRASVLVNKLLPDFVAFVAGVAAWMGSRDSRRHTADLVTATPRPRWTAWLVTWAATTIWAVILTCAASWGDLLASATQATWTPAVVAGAIGWPRAWPWSAPWGSRSASCSPAGFHRTGWPRSARSSCP